MILLLIVLISLSAIYFTRLLSKMKMKIATISVAVLYIYLVGWIYVVFIFDIADLGFSNSETRIALLHGSDIYHSFIDITDKMSVIPHEFLEAIVVASGVILFAGIAVAFHGLFEITKTVFNAANDSSFEQRKDTTKNDIKTAFGWISSKAIIRLHCRMNC